MEKHEFRPLIVVEGISRTDARNKLISLLARAELDKRISRFSVSHEDIR